MSGDLCDICGQSGKEIDYVRDGKTVCVECAEDNPEPLEYECDNCGEEWALSELVTPIPDLEERVAPGELMPAGECPQCGALCHEVKPAKPAAADACSWNPHKWQDPDEVGASEYRALHELATNVWDSNKGESAAARASYVQASVKELATWCEGILANGGMHS